MLRSNACVSNIQTSPSVSSTIASSAHWRLSVVRPYLPQITRIDNCPLGLGDTPFKQPPEFTRRILYNLSPGFPDTSPWEEFLVRNRTPPYISTEPEIVHTQLGVVSPPERSRFLILASDGFVDLCSNEGQEKIVRDWARDMQNMTADEGTHPGSGNMALRLLRRALGGEDRFKVSKVLTLNMDVAWIDDTAIVVQTL